MADNHPPSGPPGPPPHGSSGPKPHGGGAGKPSPAHGSAAVTGRPEVDRAILLRDVMDHAVRVHKETTGPQGIGKRSAFNRTMIAAVICVPLLAFSVYSLVARPEFLWGPKAGPLPAERQEANIRFAMFLLSQRLAAFRRDQGHYPASLEELGTSVPGVTYTLGNDGVYELQATEDGKAISYRSNQPLNAFLGNSFNVIQGPK